MAVAQSLNRSLSSWKGIFRRALPALLALGFALILTWGVYALAVGAARGQFPSRWEQPMGYFSDIVLHRGTIPLFELFFFWLAVYLLGERIFHLRREQRFFGEAREHWSGILEGLGVNGGGLTHDRAGQALEKLQGGSSRGMDSKSGTRLRFALRRFAKTRSSTEVDDLLNTLSGLDDGAIDSSYANLRYLVWLIPTLGFIGTVIGIGQAISGFGEVIAGAGSFSEIRTLIPGVTQSLGIAFDTTLLALLLTALISAAIAQSQKREEEQLLCIDRFCVEDVVGLFEEDHSSQEATGFSERALEILQRISLGVAGTSKQLNKLQGGIHRIVQDEGKILEEAIRESAETLEQLPDKLTEVLETSSKRTADLLETLEGELGAVSRQLGKTTEQLARYAQEGAVSDAAEFTRSVGTLANSLQDMTGHLATLEEPLAGFDRAAEALGQLAEIGGQLRQTVSALQQGGQKTEAAAGQFSDVAHSFERVRTDLTDVLAQNGELTTGVQEALLKTSDRIDGLTDVIGSIHESITGVSMAVGGVQRAVHTLVNKIH